MNYTLIETRAELLSYLKKLEEEKHYIIALDIEAESNLHAYGEKLCLIQIFDGANKILIDPLQLDNDSLRTLFENRDILKVMYDASSDQSLLKNTSNIELKSILDLRPAIELLGYKKKDLHSVIAFELGIPLEKKAKYQKYNWTNRPISEQAIYYAINDVIYLLRLKDSILKKLYAKKLVDHFLLNNLRVQNKDYTRNPEDKYKKIGGYYHLQDHEKAVFKRVFDVREKYALLCNMPPYNVINKTDLIDIVKDAQYINQIRFPKRFSIELIQEILHDLKIAIQAI